MLRWRKFLCAGMAVAAIAGSYVPVAAAGNERKGGGRQEKLGKLDTELGDRGGKNGWSRVIVTVKPGADVSGEVEKLGGRHLRDLRLINAQVVELPNGQLKKLAEQVGAKTEGS